MSHCGFLIIAEIFHVDPKGNRGIDPPLNIHSERGFMFFPKGICFCASDEIGVLDHITVAVILERAVFRIGVRLQPKGFRSWVYFHVIGSCEVKPAAEFV